MAVSQGDKRLHLLHGVRVLAICAIVFQHRGAIFFAGTVSNFSLTEWIYSQKLGIFLLQGDLVVDTFFVIGGLMLTYVLLATPKDRPLNYLQMLALRYCRLTPAYAMVIFFHASMLKSVGDGPLWHKHVDVESDSCAASWWTNLLYVNNYVDVDKLCIIQSWYLACDFHFFAVGALVLFALRHDLWLGYSLYACALVASVFSLLMSQFMADDPPVLRVHQEIVLDPRSYDTFQRVYVASHHRAAAYLVGMATGYLLHCYRDYRGTAKRLPTIGVIVGSFLMLATALGSTALFDADAPYDAVVEALVGSMRRFVWALGTAAFVVGLAFSTDSWLNRALSWRPFTPLSKLVYCAYLVHMTLQIAHSSSSRESRHINASVLFREFFGDIVWTLLVSLLLYLTTEAPMRLVFKRLLRAPTAHEDGKLATHA